MTYLAKKLGHVSKCHALLRLTFLALAGCACGLFHDGNKEREHAMPYSQVVTVTSNGDVVASAAEAGYAEYYGICWQGTSQYNDDKEESVGYHKSVSEMKTLCDQKVSCSGFQMNAGGWRGLMVGGEPTKCSSNCNRRDKCYAKEAPTTTTTTLTESDNCVKTIDEEQCEICDNNMYLSFGDCLPQCPPGSLEHGAEKTGRVCIECDGEIHQSNSGKECRPCPDGTIGKENSDACQNVQDTCSAEECASCLACMTKLQPGLDACWSSRPPESSCIDFDQLWCPEFMEGFGECEHISVGCYHKLLCHSPKVCAEWKKVRCGGETTDALVEANASEVASLVNRLREGSSQEITLDASTQGKCG